MSCWQRGPQSDFRQFRHWNAIYAKETTNFCIFESFHWLPAKLPALRELSNSKHLLGQRVWPPGGCGSSVNIPRAHARWLDLPSNIWIPWSPIIIYAAWGGGRGGRGRLLSPMPRAGAGGDFTATRKWRAQKKVREHPRYPALLLKSHLPPIFRCPICVCVCACVYVRVVFVVVCWNQWCRKVGKTGMRRFSLPAPNKFQVELLVLSCV